jgi:hypothetical protein
MLSNSLQNLPCVCCLPVQAHCLEATRRRLEACSCRIKQSSIACFISKVCQSYPQIVLRA